ncbi:uncharacterized protein [Triticum aestivum]|uniref:uncharacterized protein n=1 Tax=Triticum aestivum TaxID=4565 RepID=UPI001D0107A2|nr:uncharacterized protein LOC123126080 [Triticum aestivum]
MPSRPRARGLKPVQVPESRCPRCCSSVPHARRREPHRASTFRPPRWCRYCTRANDRQICDYHGCSTGHLPGRSIFLFCKWGMSASEHTGEHAGELRSSPSELQRLPRKLHPHGWAVAWAKPVTRMAAEGWDRRPGWPAKTGGDQRRGGQARGWRRGETRAGGETGFLFPFVLARGRRRPDWKRSNGSGRTDLTARVGPAEVFGRCAGT